MLLGMTLTNTDALKIGQMSEGDLRRFAQQLLTENAALQATNIDLVAKILWFQRITFGKKSERSAKNKAAAKAAEKAAKEASGGDAPITGTLLSTPVQNDLTDDEAEAPLTDAPAAPDTSTPPAKPDTTAKNRTHSGRRTIPKHLTVIENIIAVPEADRRLSDGTQLVFLGYEESSRLHLITEQVVQLLTRRERWGVRTNGEPSTLVTAAMPPALSVKGKFTDELILKLMLDKFSLGVPFNRQCRELNAQGAAVNRSTICDQLEIAVTPLAPIAAAVRDQLLAEPFIHADETPHKFQVRNEQGRYDRQACLAHGRRKFEIYESLDPNAAERSIRGIVIGRKNWYVAGSEDAAGWAAIRHTLIESCRLQGLDPRAYLSHVVKLLHRNPKADPATLTPRALAPQLKIP